MKEQRKKERKKSILKIYYVSDTIRGPGECNTNNTSCVFFISHKVTNPLKMEMKCKCYIGGIREETNMYNIVYVVGWRSEKSS